MTAAPAYTQRCEHCGRDFGDEFRTRCPDCSGLVEITYDHVSDGRIRHGAKVQRWRDDKPPRECLTSQLDS